MKNPIHTTESIIEHGESFTYFQLAQNCQGMARPYLEAWQFTARTIDRYFNTTTTHKLSQSPINRINRGIYVLGQIITIQQTLLPFVGHEEAVNPRLTQLYFKLPDKASEELLSLTELQACWENLKDKLSIPLHSMSSLPFQKHPGNFPQRGEVSETSFYEKYWQVIMQTHFYLGQLDVINRL